MLKLIDQLTSKQDRQKTKSDNEKLNTYFLRTFYAVTWKFLEKAKLIGVKNVLEDDIVLNIESSLTGSSSILRI